MNKILEICENIKNTSGFNGSLEQNIQLKNYTTMKVGGAASFFITPKDTFSLSVSVAKLSQAGVPCFILGGGSNVVFDDKGFDGAVIYTGAMDSIEIIGKEGDDVLVKCGAGCKTEALVDFFVEHELSGAEFFAGLPGSCGGACYMNARCYGVDYSSIIYDVEYLNFDEFSKTFDNSVAPVSKMYHNVENENEWSYKNSPFMSGKKVIVSVIFRGIRGKSAQELRQECDKYIEDRREKGHFRACSAGSVFKNNRDFGVPSGKLIDEAGLKGVSSGKAQIAPWHGNFIINTGDATSGDVKALVEMAQKKVMEKFGFKLEPEIIFP